MKRKSNVTLVFAICFLSALLLCPTVSFAKTAPKKLVLNHKNLTLYTGETETLQVISVKPKKASQNVTWKSKKPGIASVSSKGKVTAKKAGKTEIKAISKKNSKVSKSVKITVKKRPQKVEKEIAKGSIYDLSKGNSEGLKNKLYQLDTYRKKGYAVIRSKEDFQNVAGDVSYLASYAKTNFKTNSLVFIECSLFRAYNECVAGVRTKFDASGKLCGQVTVQYKRLKDEPEVGYPAVMDDYVIVLQLSKEDAAMINYFKCETEEIKSTETIEKVEKEFEVNGDIYKSNGPSLTISENTPYGFDNYYKKGYAVIPSKDAYQELAEDVSILSSYDNTDFESDSLVLIECSLFRACEEQISEFVSKFDASGKLCGQVTVQYKRLKDDGLLHLDVMDHYVIVLRLSKEDVEMIDYFECETEEIKSAEKVEKEFEVNGDIYKSHGPSLTISENTPYGFDNYYKKGYAVIPSKEAYQELVKEVSILSSYDNTDFESDSLVLIECLLFRACEEQISEFVSKFDASGKLCGQVTVQYERLEDEPGVLYPAVMDDYVIVLRLSKEDVEMIDYFKCETEEIKSTETIEKVEKEFEVNGDIYKSYGPSLTICQNTSYGFDSYYEKGYVVISSNEAYQKLTEDVSILSSYDNTDFESDSLVLIKCLLFRACEEQISEFVSKFDASDKLCGQVTVQYERLEDEPGVDYLTVMDEYVIVLRLSKEDAEMIDYFECKTEQL